jgi:hypothetical protein
MAKRFVKSKKQIKRSTLTRNLDKAFSSYIRHKYANWKGEVFCFTCPKRLPIKEIQNGHYITRGCLILRWNENNCRPQCASCNIFRNGQPVTFRENLVKEMGEADVKSLEAERFKIFKPTIEWMQEQIRYYNDYVPTP